MLIKHGYFNVLFSFFSLAVFRFFFIHHSPTRLWKRKFFELLGSLRTRLKKLGTSSPANSRYLRFFLLLLLRLSFSFSLVKIVHSSQILETTMNYPMLLCSFVLFFIFSSTPYSSETRDSKGKRGRGRGKRNRRLCSVSFFSLKSWPFCSPRGFIFSSSFSHFSFLSLREKNNNFSSLPLKLSRAARFLRVSRPFYVAVWGH